MLSIVRSKCTSPGEDFGSMHLSSDGETTSTLANKYPNLHVIGNGDDETGRYTDTQVPPRCEPLEGEMLLIEKDFMK